MLVKLSGFHGVAFARPQEEILVTQKIQSFLRTAGGNQ